MLRFYDVGKGLTTFPYLGKKAGLRPTSGVKGIFGRRSCVFGASNFAGQQGNSGRHNRIWNLNHWPHEQKSTILKSAQ